MTITGNVILGTDGQGHQIRIGLTDTGLTDDAGDKIWSLAVDSAVTIDPGNITIASVTLKDGVAATLAKVAASTAIAIANNVVGVHDPQIGQVGDLLANGTLIGLLSAVVPPTVSLGVSGAVFHSADQSAAVAAVTDAPAAGKKLVITDLLVSVGSNMIVTMSEETSGTVLARFNMLANTTVTIVPHGKL